LCHPGAGPNIPPVKDLTAKTVWDCFNIADSLTYRDAAAPSFYPFLLSSAGNTTGQCEVTIDSD